MANSCPIDVSELILASELHPRNSMWASKNMSHSLPCGLAPSLMDYERFNVSCLGRGRQA